MDKLLKQMKNITKHFFVTIMIIMIILSNFATVKAFSPATAGGKLYDTSIMGEEWVNYIKSQQGAGYSQDLEARKSPRTYDCSSFVCRMTQLYLGKPEIKPGGPSNTGSIEAESKNPDGRFEEIDPSEIRPWDILWKPSHTEFYIGGGKSFGAHNQALGTGEVNATGEYTKLFRIKGTPGFTGDSSNSKDIPFDPQAIYKAPFFFEGIKTGTPSDSKGFFEKIVLLLSNIIKFLYNAIIYALILPFNGFTALVEFILTSVFESSVNGNVPAVSSKDPSYYIDSRRSVNIENIIFDRVELLKVDIFESPKKAVERLKGVTGTGQDSEKINETVKKVGESAISKTYERPDITEEDYKKTSMGLIRSSAASMYYILFTLSIVLLLVLLILAAIKSLLASTGFAKARGKELAIIWLKAVVLTFITTLLTVGIMKINTTLIDVLYSSFKGNEAKTLGLYEQVRTDAYDFRAAVSVPSTFIYMMLVWYTIRFAIVYVKRLIAVIVLSVFGILMPSYSAIKEVITGKTGLYIAWFKELAYNIFIQPIHILIYVVFVNAILATFATHKSVSLIMVIIIFRMMLEISKKIRDMFGWDSGKSGILSGVLDETGVTLGALALISRNSKNNTLKKGKYLFEKTENAASFAVATSYNTYRRTKERFGSNEELPEQEYSNEKKAMGSGPLNSSTEYKDMEAVDLDANAALAADMNDIANQKSEEALAGSKNNIDFKEMFKQKIRTLNPGLYAETDDQGRKRIKRKRKYIDPETGKEVKSDSLLKTMRKDFMKAGSKRKKDEPALLSTAAIALKGGLSAVSSILAFPVFITDPKVAITMHNLVFDGAGIKAFEQYTKVKKFNKKKGIKTPSDLASAIRKRTSVRAKLFGRRVYKGYTVLTRTNKNNNLNDPMTEKEFILKGIGLSSIEDNITEKSLSVLRYTMNETFEDVGNIKIERFKPAGWSSGRIYRSNSPVIKERKKVEEKYREHVGEKLEFRKAAADAKFVSSLNADTHISSKFVKGEEGVKMLNGASMPEVVSTLERHAKPPKIKTSEFIKQIEEYNSVSALAEKGDDSLEIKKIEEEGRLTKLLSAKAIETLSDRNAVELQKEGVIEDEITRLLNENEVSLRDNSLILEAASDARENVMSLIENELNQREADALNKVTYSAVNVSVDQQVEARKIKAKNVEDLTLDELKTSRLDALIASAEAYRLADTYAKLNESGYSEATEAERKLVTDILKAKEKENAQKAKAFKKAQARKAKESKKKEKRSKEKKSLKDRLKDRKSKKKEKDSTVVTSRKRKKDRFSNGIF